MLPCFKEKAIAQLLDFNKYTKKKNRQTHPSLSIFLFIFTCVVVAFCPVNPLNFLLHFYAIDVWIRSENRWVLFCPVFYKSQCFQASAAFITEAEILMKPARIRRYLISYMIQLLELSDLFPTLDYIIYFCISQQQNCLHSARFLPRYTKLRLARFEPLRSFAVAV